MATCKLGTRTALSAFTQCTNAVRYPTCNGLYAIMSAFASPAPRDDAKGSGSEAQREDRSTTLVVDGGGRGIRGERTDEREARTTRGTDDGDGGGHYVNLLGTTDHHRLPSSANYPHRKLPVHITGVDPIFTVGSQLGKNS